MSYALHGRPFGETSSWWGLVSTTDEVYLFRALLKGLPITTPIDALLFVRVVGERFNAFFPMDVRGVALGKVTGNDYVIDVVMTSPQSGVAPLTPSAVSVQAAILADSDINRIYPALQVVDPEILELTGPKDAVDHWRAQPVLWDHSLEGARGHGGPTDTFATPADYSIVKGKADDGKGATPWKVDKPGFDPTPGAQTSDSTATVFLVLLGIGIVVMVGKRKTR